MTAHHDQEPDALEEALRAAPTLHPDLWERLRGDLGRAALREDVLEGVAA